uniref:hypothetical protein n=1 Tax=Acetatifactor sp. TaxID=1872090 RepID=UPI0040559CC7
MFPVQRCALETRLPIASCKPSERTFHVLLCVESTGVLYTEDETTITFRKGDCIFIPAGCAEIEFQGKGHAILA